MGNRTDATPEDDSETDDEDEDDDMPYDRPAFIGTGNSSIYKGVLPPAIVLHGSTTYVVKWRTPPPSWNGWRLLSSDQAAPLHDARATTSFASDPAPAKDGNHVASSGDIEGKKPAAVARLPSEQSSDIP